jgi:hypothetical protein
MPRSPKSMPATAEDALRSLYKAAAEMRAVLVVGGVPIMFPKRHLQKVFLEPKTLIEVSGEAVTTQLDEPFFDIDFTPKEPVLIASLHEDGDRWDIVRAEERDDGNTDIDHFVWFEGRWIIAFRAIVLPDGHDVEVSWRTWDAEAKPKDLRPETVERGEEAAWYATAVLRVAEGLRANDALTAPSIQTNPLSGS